MISTNPSPPPRHRATSAPNRVIPPIACAQARAPTCQSQLIRPTRNQRSISLLPSGGFAQRPATLPHLRSPLPSFERTAKERKRSSGRETRPVLESIDATGCLRQPNMEVIYKFLFSGPIFHQLWYSPSDDLEKGAFDKRTADFLWMMIFGGISLLVLSAIPLFESFYLGIPMVSMLLYVWSREYPNSQISMYGLVQLRVCNVPSFYLPWAMLALDVIFGSPLLPGLLGIIVGHLYYFLAVLHPLATGKNYLKTPKWVHSIVARFRIGVQANAPVRPPPANAGTGAFRGRSYRLNQ
ncbi:Derlin-1 [Dichanthelium oligosanthes]|uniref:Derlin n=1 Tax=Dichanthelium oligosanthes TaxID=888268 RepID=A0A1E5W3P3_9POAL|nr:Derlin-1 [Dichanthelium oligosanthes]